MSGLPLLSRPYASMKESVTQVGQSAGTASAQSRKEYWETVYQSKGPDDVSWFQPRPETSLRLLAAAGIGKQGGVIDVGGGASLLVDCLLDAGFVKLAWRWPSRASGSARELWACNGSRRM